MMAGVHVYTMFVQCVR